jgi:hypothetical protein
VAAVQRADEGKRHADWLLAIARHKMYSAFRRLTDSQLDEHFAAQH